MKRPSEPKKSIDGIFIQNNVIRSKKFSLKVIIAFLTIILVITCGLVLKNRSSSKITSSNSIGSIKAAISQHYLLPTDEEPALATVTDVSKLSSALKAEAQNGDRLLIYQKHQQAILYRPNIDRVIAVTPVSIDEPPSGQSN